MTCVYTGARVFFENYGMVVAADLFVVGDCVIIRWMPNSKRFPADEGDVENTHQVRDLRGCWHREDIGVTVVPANMISGSMAR